MNITIFGSGSEAHSIWVEGDRVNCTEMTLNVSEHLVVNDIIKFDIETTLLCSGRGNIFSILPSTHQDVEFLILVGFIQRADRTISAREIELVISYLIKCLRMEQLACTIARAGE